MSNDDGQVFADELWAIIAEELSHLRERNRMMHSLFMGELPREHMKLWAKQLFLLTRAGPRFLSAIHSNCENFEVCNWLVQNLYEEYGEGTEGRDHPSLCRNFGRALGMSVAELEAGPVLDCTKRFIDYCFEVTRTKHYVEALSAIGIALEGVSARGAPMVGEALKHHYGMSPAEIEFFTAHCEMDIDHSAKTLALVLKHATTPELRARVKAAVKEMTEKTLEWSIAVSDLVMAQAGEPARSVA